MRAKKARSDDRRLLGLPLRGADEKAADEKGVDEKATWWDFVR